MNEESGTAQKAIGVRMKMREKKDQLKESDAIKAEWQQYGNERNRGGGGLLESAENGRWENFYTNTEPVENVYHPKI